MNEDKVMYTMMIDAKLKEVALAKAAENDVSLAYVVRNYLAWWVNLDDLRPVVVDRTQFDRMEKMWEEAGLQSEEDAEYG